MLSFKELVDTLKKGCKLEDKFCIGVELERFSFNKNTKLPLTYEGSGGVRDLLESFAKDDGWDFIMEGDHPIALTKNGMSLTLEPGGQIEYAGSPLKNLAEVKQEMADFEEKLGKTADKLNIGFLTKGLHPDWSRDDIHVMPKQRYDIMRAYMPKKGDHGLDMMLRSCGTQLNFDFKDEADMIKKFRTSLAIQPIVLALMANSTHLDGRDTGYQSYRSHVWTDTDSDRSGFPSFVFDDDMSFEKYVEYALDVPMYFIRRDGQYIDMTGNSFRDFKDGTLKGYEGEYATQEDWDDHITTLFPEVRLKQYLELRSTDSHSPEMVMAMTAFWIGILYDNKTLNKVYDTVKDWKTSSIEQLYNDAAKYGMKAKTKDLPPMQSLVSVFVQHAEDGLQNQAKNKNAVTLLKPFRNK